MYSSYGIRSTPEPVKEKEPQSEEKAESEADKEAQTEEADQPEEDLDAEGTKVFTPVKDEDLPDELPLPEKEEAPQEEEEEIPPVPVYEDIYSSSGKPTTGRRVNLEAESKPISFTDDIDPEDFFASLKDKLRENIEDE